MRHQSLEVMLDAAHNVDLALFFDRTLTTAASLAWVTRERAGAETMLEVAYGRTWRGSCAYRGSGIRCPPWLLNLVQDAGRADGTSIATTALIPCKKAAPTGYSSATGEGSPLADRRSMSAP